MPTVGQDTGGTTVGQAFNALHLPTWWTKNISQYWNGGSEKGDDFNMGSFGQPIGSITGGKVVYVGNGGYSGSSIGQIVQVLAPDGRLFHYQHLKTSNVSVGQQVQVGTVLGTGGGCPVGAYGPGIHCTRTDQFSTGEHIEVRVASNYSPNAGPWNQAWFDPLSTFKLLGGTSATSVAAPGSGTSISSTGAGAVNVPSPGISWVQNISGAGVKIAIFLLALTLVGFGGYLLFTKQANEAAKNLAKVALL